MAQFSTGTNLNVSGGVFVSGEPEEVRLFFFQGFQGSADAQMAADNPTMTRWFTNRRRLNSGVRGARFLEGF